MAREQQFNNGQRQVINTIEDTSKYQTGDSRRLRVVADPLNIYETPEVSKLSQLTSALGTIKPKLMDWAVDKQNEQNTKDVELGKQAAQTGGIPEGEVQQYGYDSVKAVNDWTEFNERVLSNYEQGFDKDNGNLEDFIKQQWETNKFDDKSETYMSKFNPLVGKTLQKIRETQAGYTTAKVEAQNNAELTRMFTHDIKDVMGAGMEYGVSQYEARRDNLQTLFPGKTKSQLDELAYEAVSQVVAETGDTSLYGVFKQPHADKTPGLYEIPKWKDKIDTEIHKVLTAKNTARKEHETKMEKALKDAADVNERGILFEMIDINTFDDPTVRDEKLTALVAKTRKLVDSGIPISEPIIKALASASNGIDKKQETAYQAQNYVTLRLGNPSSTTIASAFNRGDISQAGFDKLMTKKESAANRTSSGDKPLTSNPYIKQALKTIDANAGYSPFNMTKDGEEARSNANAVKARMLDYVEDLIDSNPGISLQEVAKQGEEFGVNMIKEAGLANKTLSDANKKLDAVELKRKDPVGFYKSNPKTLVDDYRNKSLPKGIPPKELAVLQRQALQSIEADKKLKRHESTK
jgi:hypothetical protein